MSTLRTIDVLQRFAHLASQLLPDDEVVDTYLQVAGKFMREKEDIGSLSVTWMYTLNEMVLEMVHEGCANTTQGRMYLLLGLIVVAIGRGELEVAVRLLNGIEKLIGGADEDAVVAEMLQVKKTFRTTLKGLETAH